MIFDLQKNIDEAVAALVEDAFRAGFEAGMEWADDQEGKNRSVEDAPGESEAWERYAAELSKPSPSTEPGPPPSPA